MGCIHLGRYSIVERWALGYGGFYRAPDPRPTHGRASFFRRRARSRGAAAIRRQRNPRGSITKHRTIYDLDIKVCRFPRHEMVPARHGLRGADGHWRKRRGAVGVPSRDGLESRTTAASCIVISNRHLRLTLKDAQDPDFGFGRSVPGGHRHHLQVLRTQLRHGDRASGTPPYVSPEQL